MKYTVYNHEGKKIGDADNFAQAKELHKRHLPKDMLDNYVGLDCSNNYLQDGIAKPQFAR